MKKMTWEILEITWKQARNESFKVHEMEQLLTNKKITNASNVTITKLWLATLTKVEGSMCTQKLWKERMKDNSKPHHYILSPNPKVTITKP